MLFNTFVFTTLAAFAASVQADSCSAGAILGIYAVCGTSPVDCGSGKCCLDGQTCVGSGSKIACADASLQSGTTVTVNAGCYGSMLSHMSSPTGSATSVSASYVTNPATIATPSYTPIGNITSGTIASSSATKGASTSIMSASLSKVSSAKTTSTKATKSPSASSSAGFYTAPYTYTNGTVGYTTGATGTGNSKPSSTLPVSNGAGSLFSSTQNNVAMVLSAVAAVAFWL